MTRKSRTEKPRQSRKDKLSELLSQIEENLSAADSKPSVADFVRLVQLEREFQQEEQPREMKVTWSEPSETFGIEE